MMRGSLCGYVVRQESGRPVRKAMVEAVAGATLEPRTAHTDASGWFVLDGLPPGRWLLHAWAPDNGMGEATAPVFVNAFSDVTIRVGSVPGAQGPVSDTFYRIWVTRMQLGSVDGRVTYPGSGEPVADATVTIVRGAGPAPDIAPLTGDDGRFRFDGLPPGDWTFHAMGPGGQTGEATVRVLAGSVVEVVIVVGLGG
jgi:hypothetical protein